MKADTRAALNDYQLAGVVPTRCERPWTFTAVGVMRIITWVFAYFLIALVLQILGGAYKAGEFSAYSDSPAHHVTSIMVSEYLREGLPRSPVQFAEQYYLHYPKVAIGHWPPFYYLCAGIWGLVFGVGHTSYLAFMALLAGVLAAVLCALISNELGRWEGMAAGVLLLMLPAVRDGTQLMMLDTMVALLSLLAGWLLILLFEKRNVPGALAFGLFASFTILTKGNGIALAIAPLFVVVLTRSWEMVRRAVFWLPALVVAVIAGPWTIFTIRDTENGWKYGMGWAYTREAAPGFFRFLVDAAGPLLFVTAFYGIWRMVAKPFLRGAVRPLWAMLFALPASTYVFQVIVPASIEQRYLMAGFPSMVAFVVAGISDLVRSGWASEKGWVRLVEVGLVSAATVVGIAEMRKPHPIPVTGLATAAEYVIDRYASYPKIAILVCSDSTGEGVAISQFAARVPKPGQFIVLRASKLLAKGDWEGRGYNVVFQNNETMKKYLESIPTTLILVDRSVDAEPFMKHVVQVESMLAQGQGAWRRDVGGNLDNGKSRRKLELYAILPEKYRIPTHINVDTGMMHERKSMTE